MYRFEELDGAEALDAAIALDDAGQVDISWSDRAVAFSWSLALFRPSGMDDLFMREVLTEIDAPHRSMRGDIYTSWQDEEHNFNMVLRGSRKGDRERARKFCLAVNKALPFNQPERSHAA